MPDFKLERKVSSRGYRNIAGIDEVGRGALFGPVVAAAVIFPDTFFQKATPAWLDSVDDSKRLNPAKRDRLAALIVKQAAAVGLGWRTNFEIDRANIFQASCAAMIRAVASLGVPPDYLLVDGLHLSGLDCPVTRVVRGDQKSLSIAAASIVAKVFRDFIIVRMDGIFTGYGLASNKGYGTREHYLGLSRKGPTPLHRKTFNLGDSPGV